jgi:hypothetical protein
MFASGFRPRNVLLFIKLSERDRRTQEQSVVRPRGIEIVRRAYELWEQAGKPEGKDQEFYHEAESELMADCQRPGQTDQAGTQD